MRKLAVVHRLHHAWGQALQEAEPRLEVRGWHPRDAPDDAWLRDAEGLFVWNLPPGLVARMPRLAWIQNSGAGVDHLVGHAEIPPGIPITRADGQFGLWMARYVCAHLLQEALRVDACRAAQGERRWAAELVPEDLTGQVALVHGFGRIGRQIGRALRELGLEVRGFVRTPRADAEFPLHGAGDLGAWMGRARVLVLCAPLTSGTRGFVNASLLEHGHPGLTLVNVGRGEQVVVPDLLAALDRGTLGRAVLDVFPREPLEASSPLWDHPGVVVTPHHSGPSVPRDLIPDILENLHRFAQGQPILNAVDRTLGY
jgi:glyoxylate/hydroxypyruvate reductase A